MDFNAQYFSVKVHNLEDSWNNFFNCNWTFFKQSQTINFTKMILEDDIKSILSNIDNNNYLLIEGNKNYKLSTFSFIFNL